MPVKIKLLHPQAKIPQYGRPGDAGLDLYCCDEYKIEPGQRIKIPLGFAMELPEGTVALMWDRSGMAANHGIHSLAGVIDGNYRGEVNVVLYNTSSKTYNIKQGDKIAQMLIQNFEHIDFQEADELSDTERGEQGWLSSGK